MVFASEAMESSSVMGVISVPPVAAEARPLASSGVGWPFRRAERSAAMMERAWFRSSARNEELKPRTPVSAATPMATERMTKKNLPREECISRAAILAADW